MNSWSGPDDLHRHWSIDYGIVRRRFSCGCFLHPSIGHIFDMIEPPDDEIYDAAVAFFVMMVLISISVNVWEIWL